MAADLIQKMFASVAVTADDIAAVDVPQDAMIESILFVVTTEGADALDDGARVELSFGSSNTFNVNDSRLSIAEVEVNQSFLTTGGGPTNNHVWMGMINIPVFAGERIHLHADVNGGTSTRVRVFIYYSIGRGAPRRRSVRRR